jgi:hypothetical protein
MKKIIFLFLLIAHCSITNAQKPKDGIYTYSISFEEWKKSPKVTCSVEIKGDSIKIIDSGAGNLSGKNGDIIDEGILMKHIKTGKWIIAHSVTDKDAKEIGGCSDGPTVIDFKHKRIFLC